MYSYSVCLLDVSNLITNCSLKESQQGKGTCGTKSSHGLDLDVHSAACPPGVAVASIFGLSFHEASCTVAIQL